MATSRDRLLKAEQLILVARETGDLRDWSTAIQLLQSVLGSDSRDQFDRAMILGKLSTAFRYRFLIGQTKLDLDQAIVFARRAVAESGLDHPQRALFLSDLGFAFQVRHDATGSISDLNRSIWAFRQAKEVVGRTEESAIYLSNLGAALRQRYLAREDLTDLDDAISLGREALLLAEGDEWSRPMCGGNLASALFARFIVQRDRDDLRDALAAADRALLHAQPGDPHLAHNVDVASTIIRQVVEEGDRWTDIDCALELCLRIDPWLSPTEQVSPQMLSARHMLLMRKCQEEPSLKFIEDAISTGRDLLASLPNEKGGAILGNIALAMRWRYDLTNNPEALSDSIRLGEDSIRVKVSGDSNYFERMSNLSNSLRIRFERLGGFEDLNRAVQLARRAIQVSSTYDAHGGNLSNLALALRMRHERVRQEADLDEAIEIGRQVVERTNPGHPDRAMILSNHSVALRVRFESRKLKDDLEEAIAVARAAVSETGPNDRHRPGRLANLSVLLALRFQEYEYTHDLKEAIWIGREAVSAAPARNPNLPNFLASLAAVLLLRNERDRGADNDEESVRSLKRALDLSPMNHPDRATFALNLGTALAAQVRRGSPRVSDAIAAWRQAATARQAATPLRLLAAHAWAGFAAERGHWQEADAAYREAGGLLPVLAWRGLDRRDKERLLAQWSGLPQDATAVALSWGAPEYGLERMEEARAVLWSQLLDARADLGPLMNASPELATAIDRVRSELSSLDSGGHGPSAGPVLL